jgi:hypothetical protein
VPHLRAALPSWVLGPSWPRGREKAAIFAGIVLVSAMAVLFQLRVLADLREQRAAATPSISSSNAMDEIARSKTPTAGQSETTSDVFPPARAASIPAISEGPIEWWNPVLKPSVVAATYAGFFRARRLAPKTLASVEDLLVKKSNIEARLDDYAREQGIPLADETWKTILFAVSCVAPPLVAGTLVARFRQEAATLRQEIVTVEARALAPSLSQTDRVFTPASGPFSKKPGWMRRVRTPRIVRRARQRPSARPGP